MNRHRNFFKAFTLIAEFLLIHASCQFAYFLRYGDFGPFQDYYLSFFIIFNLAWVGSSLFNNSYDSDNLLSLRSFIRNLFTTLFLHIFLVFLYIVIAKAQYLSRLYIFYTYTTALLTITSFRALLILGYRYYNSVNYNIRKIALVGPKESLSHLSQFFDKNHIEVYRFLENLNLCRELEGEEERLKTVLEELKTFCLREQVNEIYVALPVLTEAALEDLSRFADDHFIYFRMVTDFQVLNKKKVSIEFYGHVPIVSLRPEPLRSLFNQVLKRGIDICVSLVVLIGVFSWLYPILALLIKRDSSGPAIFKQLRSGKNKEEFVCYKFRTMVVNEDSDRRQATRGDKRITKIGAFLRRTSLDELPQFINVLKGEMSVVGPRPHMIQQTEEYARIIDKYLFRHFITPGITGHAQVNGFRGETIDPSLMKKRVEYDAWYIENWSLLLDIKIMFLTVWFLLKGQEQAH